ncbi:MAG: cell division protein ZapA [Alphaproteobacteria bacterium]|nr:cell division protein ZapA [Alphaproteobacteria bacterium]
MKQVVISINGRDYDIACDDGQEDHLRSLAGYVDKRVEELAATVGQVGDLRLLVLTSLLIADELHESRTQQDERNQRREQETEHFHIREVGVASALDGISDRLETLAARIERA